MDREREEVSREREQVDKERRELREAGLIQSKRTEEAEYARRELQARVESLSAKLGEKVAECEQAARASEQAKRQVGAMAAELGELKETAAAVEAMLRKEVEELRGEVEDMGDMIKVKERMLDD